MAKKPGNDIELAALRQRFPKPSAPAAVYQCASILLLNGYLVYLVATGQSSPVAIAAFNLCELILLSAIAHLALIPVPKQARLGDADSSTFVQKIFIMLLGLVWLGGVYFISVSFDTVHVDQLRHATGVISALQDMNILWPLLFSAATTLVATISDVVRWRAKGGMFVPEYAVSAAPKILTLIFAPIPAVLISGKYQTTDMATALLVWSAVYIGIKAAAELGILAFVYAGMPEAKKKGQGGTSR